MKTPPSKKTVSPACAPRAETGTARALLLHERAVLCARLAVLLRRSLRGLDWDGTAVSDRARLERALSGLGGDIPLVWLIGGQAASRKG